MDIGSRLRLILFNYDLVAPRDTNPEKLPTAPGRQSRSLSDSARSESDPGWV